jgi:hexosaminidase
MKKKILFAVLLLTGLHAITRPLRAQTARPPKPLAVGYSIPIVSITKEKMLYAKSTGIDYLEVSFAAFIDSNRHFKMDDEAVLEKVKQAKADAENAGIKIWSVHMPYGQHIDISLGNEAERKDVVRLHKQILAVSKVLEPKVILFHPSYYLGLDERALRKKQMIKSAIELNEAVKNIGAIMVVENMLGPELKKDANRERPLCRTVDETLEIFSHLPADIYSAVDMNHIRNPEKLIRAMGTRLKSVHIADGNGREENHYLPCSGKGENNWIEILSALEAAQYKGPFIYESKVKDINELKPCYDSLYNAFISDKYSH